MTEANLGSLRPKGAVGAVRRPVHLAVAAGLSAAAYAASLAGVSALQSAADRDVIDERAPTAAALDELQTEHVQLEARLAAAAAEYNQVAGAYAGLTEGVSRFETDLGSLAKQVREVEGSAVALPTVVRFPSVGRSTWTAPKPMTHATTGASGVP